MKIALVISTYNNPRYLSLCLKSIARQKRMPDEILIADDGSGEDTRKLIGKMKERLPGLKHIWQEDNGFRKSRILNRAVLESESDYIVLTDQDCILHRNFISDHEKLAERGLFLSGYRTRISENYSEKILNSSFLPGSAGLLIRSKLNAKYSLHLKPLWRYTHTVSAQYDGVFGCNMSFWKNDFIAVNGFNEDFEGWGPEDSELAARLINTGIRRKHLYFSAIVFHIHHTELSKEMLEKNKNILTDTVLISVCYAPNGLYKPQPAGRDSELLREPV